MKIRTKHLLGIAVLGLGLLLFQQLGGAVAAVAILSGMALMFGDDPTMRPAFQPSDWVERRRGRLLLAGFGLLAAAIAWLVMSIAWGLEPGLPVMLPFMALLLSAVLLLGLVFYSWLMRVLLGKN